MKNQVKTFFDTRINRLEEDINEWLTKHSDATIVNIEYSMSSCGNSGGAIYTHYSALVHYTEGEN